MPQIFGDFVQAFPPEHDSLELTFTPTSERIKDRWRNQRLSAHFLADYFINFSPFKKHHPEDETSINETKGAVSYLANELLENAMKFSSTTVSNRVKLGIHFVDDADLIAVIFATNTVAQAGTEKLQTFIEKLLASDPEEFYIQQVEASAEDETSEMSGLGLLTMINDYQAKLGWRFDRIQPESDLVAVTTMAQITV